MRTDVIINKYNAKKVLEEDLQLSPFQVAMIMEGDKQSIALALSKYYRKKLGNLEKPFLSTSIKDLPLIDFIVNRASNSMKIQHLDRKTIEDLYFVSKGLYGESLDPRTQELVTYGIRAIEIQLMRLGDLRKDFNRRAELVKEHSKDIVDCINYKRENDGYIYIPNENYPGTITKVDSSVRNYLKPIILYADPTLLGEKEYFKMLDGGLLIKKK